LVRDLLEARKHLGLMMPTPVQAAMTAALDDDAHVVEQRGRYSARRQLLLAALREAGFTVDHSEAGLYLWVSRDESCMDTLDWFAQDNAGNVWYFGEFATEFKNGKVIGHDGSWEAGVDGAKAGIVMEAKPKVGDTYQQELAPGVAEDMATVLSLKESVCVPYGCFSNVLKTRDFSPLEPGVAENKYYAPGVGQIKTVMVEGGSEVSELVDVVTD
jgi:hypothetical protein